MVTMQDVARAAGVSLMTVSNVINEHPHVKPATKNKVLQAIADLDYRVNVAARNLRQGRTGTIGLAVPEVDRPYYGQLAARIIAHARRHGLRVAVEQTGANREGELDALALSRNRLYDGLILAAVGLGPADRDLLRVDYPVVVLGERIFDGPVDHIAMANVAGTRAATEHLVERGCRAIVMFGGDDAPEPNVASLRLRGFDDAIAAAGMRRTPDRVVRLPEFTLAAGAAAARDLVRSGAPFDGAVCVTDTVALGVVRGLADARVEVPGEVRVIGFDNIEEGAFSVPTLSTIDPDHEFMASRAVELVADRLRAPDRPHRPQEIVSNHRLVVRESTG
jgi:DNA-binding LacI/PurR family transcriptional regulator